VVLGRGIWNLYFHSLSSFPGPWYARASTLPYVYWLATGELTNTVRRIHEEYGDEIRIAPNKLSYVRSQAWPDIHGED
jgi:aspirochlorine biosynthesis cytochrome P450 monooxygenase